MKRIYLQKVTQVLIDYYVGTADPRDIVRMATKIEIGAIQDAQRPLNGNRVKEIANYVNEGGMLPNSIVLATKDSNYLSIGSIEANTEDGCNFTAYYVAFPSTPSEFEDFKDKVFVMDGQHRLYSFEDQYRLLPDETPYQIGFSLFVTPTLTEQRKIFMNTNEKQEKVSSNLLMWFREQLDMLSGPERLYYPLIRKLNEENISPLKGRIIMSAEKVKNGMKAQQMIRVLDKARFNNMNIQDVDKQLKVISLYLTSWGKVCGFDYSHPTKNDGASTKIAGFRFLMILLPEFLDLAKFQHQPFGEAFIISEINNLFSSLGITGNEIFTSEKNKLFFRGESPTIEFAEKCVQTLKANGSGSFDPLA